MGEEQRETSSCQTLNFRNLIVDSQGTIINLTINRPRTLNNLSVETLRELVRFFESMLYNKKAKVIVVKGSGDKAFIAGADIKELYSFDVFDSLWFCDLGHKLFNLMEQVPQLIIAVIDGYCMGGGFDFAMSCDIRIATPKARIAHTAAKMGLITGFGGTQRLIRLLNLRKAKEIFYTANIISADDALKMGIVHEVISKEKLEKRLEELLKHITAFKWEKIYLLKSLLNKAKDFTRKSYMKYETFTTYTRCCYGLD